MTKEEIQSGKNEIPEMQSPEYKSHAWTGVLDQTLTTNDPFFGRDLPQYCIDHNTEILLIIGQPNRGKTTIADEVERKILWLDPSIDVRRMYNDRKIAEVRTKYPDFPQKPNNSKAWGECSNIAYKTLVAPVEPAAGKKRVMHIGEVTGVGTNPKEDRFRSTVRRLHSDIVHGAGRILVLMVVADEMVTNRSEFLREKITDYPNNYVIDYLLHVQKTRIAFDEKYEKILTEEQKGYLAKKMFGRKGPNDRAQVYEDELREQRETQLADRLSPRNSFMKLLVARLNQRAYRHIPSERWSEYYKVIGQAEYILHNEYGFDEEHGKVLINPYLNQIVTMYYDGLYDEDLAAFAEYKIGRAIS